MNSGSGREGLIKRRTSMKMSCCMNLYNCKVGYALHEDFVNLKCVSLPRNVEHTKSISHFCAMHKQTIYIHL